jgi:hypothetical protein
MAPQFPSIESFFQAIPSSSVSLLTSSYPLTLSPPSSLSIPVPSSPGDGFSDREVNAVLHPQMDSAWAPDREYAEFDIADLEPGPRCVAIHGRVVNFYDRMTPNKRPKAAKGCVKFVLKDNTGALTVCARRFFSSPLPWPYQLLVGPLVVCKHGIQPPLGAIGVNLDSTYFEWRTELSGGVAGSVVHEHLPREGSKLPFYTA